MTTQIAYLETWFFRGTGPFLRWLTGHHGACIRALPPMGMYMAQRTMQLEKVLKLKMFETLTLIEYKQLERRSDLLMRRMMQLVFGSLPLEVRLKRLEALLSHSKKPIFDDDYCNMQISGAYMKWKSRYWIQDYNVNDAPITDQEQQERARLNALLDKIFPDDVLMQQLVERADCPDQFSRDVDDVVERIRAAHGDLRQLKRRTTCIAICGLPVSVLYYATVIPVAIAFGSVIAVPLALASHGGWHFWPLKGGIYPSPEMSPWLDPCVDALLKYSPRKQGILRNVFRD
jgi:hypothetical protein